MAHEKDTTSSTGQASRRLVRSAAPRLRRRVRRISDEYTLPLFPWLVHGQDDAPVTPPPNQTPKNGLAWMTTQLCTTRPAEKPRHNNPRPAGVIRPGSGSDVLLRYLRQHPQRWFFHPELVLTLGRSKGEIDWALQYLAGQGLIASEMADLPGRKAVMRYRLRQVG